MKYPSLEAHSKAFGSSALPDENQVERQEVLKEKRKNCLDKSIISRYKVKEPEVLGKLQKGGKEN